MQNWRNTINKLKEAPDGSTAQELFSLLHQEIHEGHVDASEAIPFLENLYMETKNPWLSTELKRLQNRLRSRQVLGRDLLRLSAPPLGEPEIRKLWEDVNGLKHVYERSPQAQDSFTAAYDVQEKIGEGGMSVVFRAIRQADQREVAIKYLREKYFNAPAIVARFQRECRLSATFDHPRLVTVFEAGEHDGAAYLVMEYLPLGGMDEMLGKPEVTPKRALGVIRQTAEALAYLHGRQVVHRDVKLSNLLVVDCPADTDKAIEIKLTDFGLSKELPGDGLTKVGTRMGTEFYAAPEMRTSPETVDHRADIYSLGVALYRLLSAKGFPEGNYPALHELHPQLPKELDELLQECLEVDPGKRLSSAMEVAERIGLILNSEL